MHPLARAEGTVHITGDQWYRISTSGAPMGDGRRVGPDLVLDGTLVAIGRVAADCPFYSGKHHRHGMNLQMISAPDGGLLWVSGPLRRSVHDLKAARIWDVIRAPAATGILVLADKA